MKLVKLTYIILELNASLDSGKHDDVKMQEATEHIEAGDVVPWLNEILTQSDLSLLSGSDIEEYHAMLKDLLDNHSGRERRKWGVSNRALCLLIAWTNEMLQRAIWQPEPQD